MGERVTEIPALTGKPVRVAIAATSAGDVEAGRIDEMRGSVANRRKLNLSAETNATDIDFSDEVRMAN
mgnify:CR=1 FL=1